MGDVNKEESEKNEEILIYRSSRLRCSNGAKMVQRFLIWKVGIIGDIFKAGLFQIFETAPLAHSYCCAKGALCAFNASTALSSTRSC